MGQTSKICSQALLFGHLLTSWHTYNTSITWSVIAERCGPLNITCPYSLGGRLFSTQTLAYALGPHFNLRRLLCFIGHLWKLPLIKPLSDQISALAYGCFRTWGAVTFLPEKFTNARLLKSAYERTQIERIRKTNSLTNYRVAGNFFCASLISRILDLSGFAGKKKTRIWSSVFTCGNKFSRISCTVFEINKNESHVIICNQSSAM